MSVIADQYMDVLKTRLIMKQCRCILFRMH